MPQGFTFTEDDDNTLIEKGKYQVTITSLTKKASKADPTKTNLNVAFAIRYGLNQKYEGRIQYETIAQDKNIDVNKNGWWADLKKFSKLVRAALPPTSYGQDGKPRWDIKDADTAIQQLTNANLAIYIDTEYDDYSEKEVNRVKYLSYEDAFDKAGKLTVEKRPTIEISQQASDDLPF